METTTLAVNELEVSEQSQSHLHEQMFVKKYRDNIERSETYWAFEIDDERLLTEMDHLRLARGKEGIHKSEAIEDIKQNYITAIYERAIPNGVSRFTYNRWLGKTPNSVASSGYRWHRAAQAYRRVDIEVEAANSIDQDLPIGYAKIIISPRMSDTDAPKHIAKSENLDQYDSIQVYYATSSGIEAEAILVEGVNLSSWYEMLGSDNRILDSSIELCNENDSALDIMDAHTSMVIPAAKLKRGVVSILEEVMTFEKDMSAYSILRKQFESFNQDQGELNRHANIMAQEWLRFDIQLEEALDDGIAKGEVADFIEIMQPKLDKHTQVFVEAHQTPGGYVMTRKLAALAEDMKRNTVWTRTGVRVHNQEVIDQIDPENLRRIVHHEQAYDVLSQNRMMHEVIEMSRLADSTIASMNIDAGSRGCPAGGNSRFAGEALMSAGNNVLGSQQNEEEIFCPEIKNGQKGKCPGCKHQVSIIVKGDKLFCPRGECKLANSSTKRKTNKTPSSKGAWVFNIFSIKKKEVKADKIAA